MKVLESMDIDTHNLICDFGMHKGVLYTRIPVSYLKWMVNSNHDKKDIAEAELKRRGTVTPEIDVSGHAIDKASLRCLDIWQKIGKHGEGLHAWLVRVSLEALKNGIKNSEGKYSYRGLRFVFVKDGIWPVLKTVMRE